MLVPHPLEERCVMNSLFLDMKMSAIHFFQKKKFKYNFKINA